MKYVSNYRDRHGRKRYRFRRSGADFPICSPDAPEFADEYTACLLSAEKVAALREREPHLPLITQARNYLSRLGLRAPGYIYFVYGDTGRVKIGFTKNPLKRFGHLRTNCPDRLTLLAIIPGTIAGEKGWHERFNADHIVGEWYRSTTALRKAIKAEQTRTLANHDVPVRHFDAQAA